MMRTSLILLLLLAVTSGGFYAGRVTATPSAGSAPATAPIIAERSPSTGDKARATAPAPVEPMPVLDTRASVAPLVDRVKGSVVTITSRKTIRRAVREDPWSQMLRERFGMGGPPSRDQQVQGLGSGFVLDKKGTILTNNHVVAGADEVEVKLADERIFPARVIGTDPPTDVAVLKITNPPVDLLPVALGDSDSLRVGDYVLAIGNPLGLGQTVTMGLVSAKNRSIGDAEGGAESRYQDFIQTDAAINQGNSGGPLFNFSGQVVGINTMIINPSVAMNIGFAIPINLARSIAEQIGSSGRVARGYLGVSGVEFTPEIAGQMRVPYAPGALINYVEPRSPAALGGLQPNDVIVEIGGKAITSSRRLPTVVATFRPGERVKVAFLRGGKRMESTVELAAPAGGGEAVFGGLKVRPLAAREAQAMGLRAGQGVQVIGVDPRSGTSGAIEEGDLILEADRRPVTVELLRLIEARLQSGGRTVLLIQRGDEQFRVILTE